MGGVRTLKWEGFGNWWGGGGRVLDIGEGRVGHRGEGLDIREGRGLHVEGGRWYPRTMECF